MSEEFLFYNNTKVKDMIVCSAVGSAISKAMKCACPYMQQLPPSWNLSQLNNHGRMKGCVTTRMHTIKSVYVL